MSDNDPNGGAQRLNDHLDRSHVDESWWTTGAVGMVDWYFSGPGERVTCGVRLLDSPLSGKVPCLVMPIDGDGRFHAVIDAHRIFLLKSGDA